MHILVTRPERDVVGLKNALTALGHTVLLAPMLQIAFLDVADIELVGVAGLIVTSRNGVRAIVRHPQAAVLKAMPLFAVGTGTTDEAVKAGFQEVVSGPGTAADLAAVIAKTADPKSGALIHAAGDHLATDLCADLEAYGFQVHRHVVYASRQVTQLSDELVAALTLEKLDAVILMSPRTAKTFVDLVLAQSLGSSARKLEFFCLSAAVASQLERLALAERGVRVQIAAKPNTEELLALL